jgi:hypothetical protein
MVYFQPKNPNLGKFYKVLQWKLLVHFMTIWSILRPFEIFYGHLVFLVVIWCIFPLFGILYQEKSGNPAISYVGGVYMYVNLLYWKVYSNFRQTMQITPAAKPTTAEFTITAPAL